MEAVRCTQGFNTVKWASLYTREYLDEAGVEVYCTPPVDSSVMPDKLYPEGQYENHIPPKRQLGSEIESSLLSRPVDSKFPAF